MSPETINILSNVIVALFTLITTVLVTMLLRKRKVVQYDVFSMPLLRFRPKQERTLVVSIDKSIVTGKEADKGQQTPITNAFGFEVDVVNVGNEDITDAYVKIRLHKSAKIIECETLPPSSAHYHIRIEVDDASPNVRRVLIPYINRRDRLIVRLISTDNETRDCKVDIRGLGIKIRRRPGVRIGLQLLTAAMPIIFFGIIDTLYPSFFESLGVIRESQTITKTETKYPPWLLLIILAVSIAPFVIVVVTNINEFRRPRRVKEYGSGGIVKVEDWDLDGTE